MHIPGYTPFVFSLFQFWLHHQRLRWHWGDPPPNVKDLIYLWLLAEITEVPSLQNTVIHFLNVHPDKVKQLGMTDYNEIWDKKLKNNQLLGKFVVNTIAMSMKTIEHPEHFPKDMLCEIFKAARVEILRLETRERQNGRILTGHFTKFSDTQLPKYLISGRDSAGELPGADPRTA